MCDIIVLLPQASRAHKRTKRTSAVTQTDDATCNTLAGANKFNYVKSNCIAFNKPETKLPAKFGSKGVYMKYTIIFGQAREMFPGKQFISSDVSARNFSKRLVPARGRKSYCAE